ncbi:unnamed protein product [Paramecium octaurelia]|uniref:Transmembrane protein n=1 Tax=Paramecium octaurelia TaxID=43137 RepID=A0A8S1VCV4_PAROT|nr:unnamed protein product [Paramecium octaurelia]
MIKQLQVDEEQKKLQNNSSGQADQIKSPASNQQRLDSGPDAPIQKMTPSASPLLRNNKPLLESKLDEPINPAVTPFQQSSKKIQFTGVRSEQTIQKSPVERIPYEKYHRNGNVSLQQLNLPQLPGYKLEFGPMFLIIMGLSFPFGILLAYISSEFDSGTFTFVNCWLLIGLFTLSLIQQLYTHKNGLCNYILSKTELDFWNEQKFIKIMWGIRIVLLIVNLCLTIYYGYSVWNDNISDSIISIFVFLTILTFCNMIFIIFIFYAIIPVSNKQLVVIKERVDRIQRMQENIQVPLSFQFCNQILGVFQHGSEGNIYQSTIASQNYQKFVNEVEERQRELLRVASSRNDKLTHDANDFVNKLTKQLKEKKDDQMKVQRMSNPGIAPFDILVNYVSFFFLYCIGFPVFLYFAMAYQEVKNDYLPLLFFLYPFSLYVWKKFTLCFFTMKQFVDYNYESKIVILGVTGYRIGTMSVQRLGVGYFIQFLIIKFVCKILYYWIIVFGYYFNLEQRKQMYMNYIRGSVVDNSQQKNKLQTKKTGTLIQSAAQVKDKRQSLYEAQEQETPSFSKTAANWIHVDNIENIKKALITKQIFGFVLQEVFEIVIALLFVVLSSILYNEKQQSKKWSTFDVNDDEHQIFQLEIGLEILVEFAFCIITIGFYIKQLKIPNTYSFFQQIQHIIGNDGLKSLIYDYCFAIVVCFLIVGNKFEIK